MSHYDAFDDAPLDETEDARLIKRPDGSIVAKPHVKKVKTGTWVFYPNKKSEGRSFKTYGRAKKIGGEPDSEYNPRLGRKPAIRDEEPIEDVQDVQDTEPIPRQVIPEERPPMGIFGEVLSPRRAGGPARRPGSIADRTVSSAIDNFLGFG